MHRDGDQVVDGYGEPVLLRGMGLGNWLLPEGYMWGIEPPGPLSAPGDRGVCERARRSRAGSAVLERVP